MPAASTTMIERSGRPISSLKTPYFMLTAPCGQKSDASGYFTPPRLPRVRSEVPVLQDRGRSAFCDARASRRPAESALRGDGQMSEMQRDLRGEVHRLAAMSARAKGRR